MIMGRWLLILFLLALLLLPGEWRGLSRFPASNPFLSLSCIDLLRFQLHRHQTNELYLLLKSGLDFEELIEQVDQTTLLRLQSRLQNPRMANYLNVRHLELELSVVGRANTGGTASGDFYRLIELPDGRISFFLGDIEGHGKSAAIRSLQLHQLFDQEKNLITFYGRSHRINAESVLKYLDMKSSF